MSHSLDREPRSSELGPTRQQLDELDALLQRMLAMPVSQTPEPDDLPADSVPQSRPSQPVPVRSYQPDPEDDSPPPGYPPTLTLIGAAETTAPESPIAPRVMSTPLLEPPVPGGRHDLEADTPVDPMEELARIRAMMQERATLPPTAHLPTASNVEGGEWVPLRSSWQPSAQTWKPLAERWEQSAPTFPPRSTASGPVVMTQTASDPECEIPTIPPAPVVSQPAPPPAPEPTPTPEPVSQPRTSWPLLPLVWFNAGFDLVLFAWCPKGKFMRGPAGRAVLGFVGILCLLAATALAVADGLGWTW